MFQQPDWIALAVAFVIGTVVGIASMYAFRNYEVRQVLRLKGELEAEHRLLWQRLEREPAVGIVNRDVRPTPSIPTTVA